MVNLPRARAGYPGIRPLIMTALAALLLASLPGCRPEPDYMALFPGTWERTIEGSGYSFSGSLTFRADGTFAFTFEGEAPGHTRSEGKWSLVGRDITFLDDSCPDPGTYRFLFKGDTLSFLPLRDDCGLRKNALSGDWTLAKG